MSTSGPSAQFWLTPDVVSRIGEQVKERRSELERLEEEQAEVQQKAAELAARLVRKRKELKQLESKHIQAIVHEDRVLAAEDAERERTEVERVVQSVEELDREVAELVPNFSNFDYSEFLQS